MTQVDAAARAIEIDDERVLVERAQAGDPSALEPLLARHAEGLFSSVLLPRAGDRALAEDLLKETCVTAIEKIGAFRWQGRSLFHWLRQIALNKLIDHHRRAGRSRRAIDRLTVEAEAAEPAAGADAMLIAAEDRQRARGRIDEALASLPARYGTAIRLRLVEERPREECAQALGVTVGNFDVILFRAVRAFRKAYGDPDGG